MNISKVPDTGKRLIANLQGCGNLQGPWHPRAAHKTFTKGLEDFELGIPQAEIVTEGPFFPLLSPLRLSLSGCSCPSHYLWDRTVTLGHVGGWRVTRKGRGMAGSVEVNLMGPRGWAKGRPEKQ